MHAWHAKNQESFGVAEGISDIEAGTYSMLRHWLHRFVLSSMKPEQRRQSFMNSNLHRCQFGTTIKQKSTHFQKNV